MQRSDAARLEKIGEGVKFQRVRRIVGYLAPVDRWNAGKLWELKKRKIHVALEGIPYEQT